MRPLPASPPAGQPQHSPTGPDRWAQLTYTSVDAAAAGAGGWQIKQSNAFSEAERTQVLADIPTRLPLTTPVSRYPSEQELAALPRRLALIPYTNGSALFVHTAPAGNDASGRPGNVFTHALLDRWSSFGLAGPDPVRPIELWRADLWLAPYGPDAVRDAWFDERQTVVRGQRVTRDTVVDFLYDEQYDRVDSLALLLDATQAAIAGGRPVVIVADNTDAGATWLGLVSFLAPPKVCARLSFSTYEHTADLLAHGTRMVLSVVLRDDFYDPDAGHDVSAATQGALMFVDLSSTAPRMDGASRLHVDVARPPRSTWGELMRGLYHAGDDLFDDRLLAMDGVNARYASSLPLCPSWPLAVSIAECAELESLWPAAVRIVLRETPPQLRVDESLAGTVRNLMRRTGLLCGAGNGSVVGG